MWLPPDRRHCLSGRRYRRLLGIGQRRNGFENSKLITMAKVTRTKTPVWGFYHQGFSVGISTVDLSTKQAAHTDFGHQPTLLLR